MSESVLLNELQLLLSMYDLKTQVRFDDPDLADLLGSYQNSENEFTVTTPILDKIVKSSISFTVKVNEDLEIDVRVPSGYPKTEAISATCTRNAKNSHQQMTKLNRELRNMINEHQSHSAEDGYCDILSIINFCQDYQNNEQSELTVDDGEESSTSKHGGSSGKQQQLQNSDQSPLSRIWIYSHHIYNKKKRKFLVDKATELKLNGFSLPGKPGFVCIEGDEDACDEYWTKVRQLTWQKISLITKQMIPVEEVCFDSFQELGCTKSDFIKYLDEKNISFVIKEYLRF